MHFFHTLQSHVHSALQGTERFYQISVEFFTCVVRPVCRSYFFIQRSVQHLVQHGDIVHALVGASSCSTNKYKAFSSSHNAQEHATGFVPVGLYSSLSNLRGQRCVFFNYLELHVLYERQQALGQELLERITSLNHMPQCLLGSGHIPESGVGTARFDFACGLGYLGSDALLDVLQLHRGDGWVLQHLGCAVTKLGSFERTSQQHQGFDGLDFANTFICLGGRQGFF